MELSVSWQGVRCQELCGIVLSAVDCHQLCVTVVSAMQLSHQLFVIVSPRRLAFAWWGCCSLYFWHKPTKLAHSFLSCYCVSFGLYGPFNCISFHKFSGELSAFSLCSSGLISALFVLSTIHLFMKVSFSPDIILFGWLGLKHQLTNWYCCYYYCYYCCCCCYCHYYSSWRGTADVDIKISCIKNPELLFCSFYVGLTVVVPKYIINSHTAIKGLPGQCSTTATLASCTARDSAVLS